MKDENGNEVVWNKPQRVTLGLPSKIIVRVMDEWIYRNAPVAMTVKRAKTKGLVLCIMDIEESCAAGIVFASWCIQAANGAAKVDIKPL